MQEFASPLLVRNCRISVSHRSAETLSVLIEEVELAKQFAISEIPNEIAPVILRLLIIDIEKDSFLFDELESYIEGNIQMLLNIVDVLHEHFLFSPELIEFFLNKLEGDLIANHALFIKSEWLDSNSSTAFLDE